MVVLDLAPIVDVCSTFIVKLVRVITCELEIIGGNLNNAV